MPPSESSLFKPALKGIFAAVGSDAVQKVLGIFSVLIILSSITPYEYGIWQLVLSVLTAFDVILFPSIGAMLIADVSREIGAGNTDRASALIRRSVPTFVGIGALATLLMFFIAPHITRISGIDLSLLLQVLSLALFAEGISQGYQLVFQGTLALIEAQALKVLKRLGYVVGIGIFVFGFHMGLSGIVNAYAISLYLPLILFFPTFIRRYRMFISRVGDHSVFREAVWERGRWLIAADFVGAGMSSSTPWIIGYFLSVAEVGYISLAVMVLGQVSSLAPASFILRSILPRTLQTEGRTHAWLVRAMKYGIWSQLVGGLLAVLAVVMGVPLFFPLYVPAVPLIAALMLVLPFQAIGAVASEWFYAVREQKSLFLLTQVPKVLFLLLLPFFLMHLGLAGYAVWNFLSTDILTYLRLRFMRSYGEGPIRLRDILKPDPEDRIIFGRVLDSIWKLRYTRQ